MATTGDLFKTDANWAAYAVKHGLTIPAETITCPVSEIDSAVLDIDEGRSVQAASQATWASEHPLSTVGYESRKFTVKVRDGAEVSVKASWPSATRLSSLEKRSLPVLFVTHGGGWIQGTHISEEQWMLWPLYEQYNLAIISVEYRLAPEHKFPTWINDSWDVLECMLADPVGFVANSNITLDIQNIILAGSSAGAGITAVLSQKCRDDGIPIKNVILNVPLLCDYRHFPSQEFLKFNNGASLSYEQCTNTYLTSQIMKAIWELVIPSPVDGQSPVASPLLGRTEGLPPHLIFVAGQDPLRDEGLLYAHKLQSSNVLVQLKVYPGVPHAFAEIHDLESTKQFWTDLRDGLDGLIPKR